MVRIWSELAGLRLREQLADFATVLWLLFWGSLAVALGLAGVAAYPVNKWLIGRGKGHAAMHGHH